MKPTLYEALGLSRTSTEAEIKTALRRLVRRYYTRTRAGHTDVEEALRFLNHASHILGNPARRAEYDANLAETIRSANTPAISATFQGEIAGPGDTELGESISQLGLPRDRAPPPELAQELSAQLADIRRTPAGQLIALTSTALLLAIAWFVAVPRNAVVPTLGFTLSMVICIAAVAGVVWGIVHLLSRSLWQLPAPENALSLVEGMIPRWRKDRTVFLGTGAPAEDATWLFRLRMAEMKRVKVERVSDPQPGIRLFARLFDYAVWGLAYAFVVIGLSAAGLIPAAIADVLLHPLVAPLLITATWIPVEAALLSQLQTTPGRWLLCVYLQQGVSNPYAPEELRFTFRAAGARALDVWMRGCALWLPIVSMFAVARSREVVKRTGETRWDSQRDCLVTYGPVGRLSLLTLAIGLIACALVYGARWREPTRALMMGSGRAWSSLLAQLEPPKQPSAPIVSVPQARISRLDDPNMPPASDTLPMSVTGPGASAPSPSPVNDPPLTASVASERAMAVENDQPAAVVRRDEAATQSAAAAAGGPAAGGPPPPVSTPRGTAVGTAVRTAVGTAPSAPPPSPVSPPVTAPPSPSQSPAPAHVAASAASPSQPEPHSATPAATTVPPTSPRSSGAADAVPSVPAESSTPPAESGSTFSPKTFFANLWKKPRPAEPVAAPPMPEEPRPPSPIELRDHRVTEYMRQAQRQQLAGDYASLVRTCTRWADDDWKNPRAYYCLGLGLQGTGQHKQAILMFNKAGSLLPRDDPLKQQIGDAVIRSFRAQNGG